MDQYEHLLLRVDDHVNGKRYALEPRLRHLDEKLDAVSDSHTVALLDDLGLEGWQLVAVQEDRFWLRRPLPTRAPGAPYTS